MTIVLFGLLSTSFTTPLLIGLVLGIGSTLAAGLADRRRRH